MLSVAHRRSGADNRTTSSAEASAHPLEDPVNLSLVAIEKEGLVKLAASGSITADNFDPSGKNPLERILGQNWSSFRVLLDMKLTTYIDSSAIGWLIGSHTAFNKHGGTMVIHDVPPNIKQMLDLLHVGKVVPIAPNAQAARDMVNSNTGGTGNGSNGSASGSASGSATPGSTPSSVPSAGGQQ